MDTPQEQRKLPPHPSLEHLQKQAKQRVKAKPGLQLAAAQHEIALEYGFENWAALARKVRELAGEAPPIPNTPLIRERLEKLVAGTNGAAAAVTVRGTTIEYAEAGQRPGHGTERVTAQTLFDAGGASNVFTALLLAETERLGKVSRFDSAAKYLFPADEAAQRNLSAITLLSLATHTSGLPAFPPNFLQLSAKGHPGRDYPRPALIDAFRSAGAAARPPRYAGFSNFGFALLAEALAAAWGATFDAILTERILRPLGMDASQVVPGFLGDGSSGGLMTNTQDMAKFLTALNSEAPHPLREAFNATLTPQFESGMLAGGYVGLGWMLGSKDPQAFAWHNSLAPARRSFIGINRKAGVGAALFTNAARDPDVLGFELLGVKRPRPRVERVQDAASYLGFYPLGDTPAPWMPQLVMGIEIKEFRGTLMAQINGGAELTLRSLGPDRFAMGGSSMEIAFERDSSGGIVALNWTQRGVRGPTKSQPAKVTLATDALTAYAGSYSVTPALTIEITVIGDELLIQATDHTAIGAFASAKDDFVVKNGRGKLNFRRDENDRIASVVWLRGGRNLVGKKKSENSDPS